MRNLRKNNSLIFKIIIFSAIFAVILAPNGISSFEENEDDIVPADFPASVVLCWWWKLNPSIRLIYPKQHEYYAPGTEVKCMIHLRMFSGHRDLSVKYLWSNDEQRPDFDSDWISWSRPWITTVPDYLEDGDIYLHIKAQDSWGFRKYKTYHFKLDAHAPIISLISPNEADQYEPGTIVNVSIDDGIGSGISKAKFIWSEIINSPDWKKEGNDWEYPYITNIPSNLKNAEFYLHSYAEDSLGFNTTKTFTFSTSSNKLPIADFSFDPNSIIAGQIIAFSFTGSNGDEPAIYEWNFGDGSPVSTETNPIHTYSTPGTYSVGLIVTDIDGDIDSILKTDLIEVLPDLMPDASFVCLNSSIIAGQLAEFSFEGSEGNAPSEFQWNFGDGSQNSTDIDPIHQYTAPGNYDITLTISDIDGDVSTVKHYSCIEVIPDAAPLAAFMAETVQIIAGQSIEFSFTGSEGNAPATFAWDFGDSSPISTDMHPSHQYTTAGIYTVTLTVTDFDGDPDEISKIDYIEVLPDLVPIADFEADSTSVIASQEVNFQFTGFEGNNPAVLVWNFGDGTGDVTGLNPTHIYSSEGVYTVNLTIVDSNGDSDAIQKTDYITVTQDFPVAAEFDTIIKKQIAGLGINFEFNGWLGNEPTILMWDFGDGSEISNEMTPMHIYYEPGFYTVTLTVTDIDGDTNTIEKIDFIEIIADEIPSADFKASVIEQYGIVSIGQEILFEFTGEEGNTPVEFRWDFGDESANSTLRDPFHTYSGSGIYTVTLTIIDFNGDVDVERKLSYVEVTADLQPSASFTVNATTVETDEDIKFTFTGSPGNIPSVFSWNFGDGSVSNEVNPVHAYTAEGSYIVVLTVTDANGDTSVDSVEIVVDNLPSQTNPGVLGGLIALSIGGVVGVAGVSTQVVKKYKAGSKERILDKIEPVEKETEELKK